MDHTKINEFIEYCEKELDLYNRLIVNKEKDPNDSFYKSLPMCIIDAVFSIGVKYKHVEKAERAFIKYFNLKISKKYPIVNEYTIDDFLKNMNTFSTMEEAAKKGFQNRQKTSTNNGILKAEACKLVAEVFKKHGINTLKDFNEYSDKKTLDDDIRQVKGQSSGIMLKYLYMLAGKTDEIKPDRHMIGFVKRFFKEIQSDKQYDEIINIIKITVEKLKPKYPMLTERYLDVLIWSYMSSEKVYVLTFKTTLPNVCNTSQDTVTRHEVFEYFENAKDALKGKIQHYTINNLIFDQNRHIRILDAHAKVVETREKELYDDCRLTSEKIYDIQNLLCSAFEDKSVIINDAALSDDKVTIDISKDELKICVNHDLFILHTNIFNIIVKKNYFLHIKQRFENGEGNGEAELYIDLNQVQVQPKRILEEET